ncbi:hypothetical protein JCM10213_000297 [Rhodosporidiobolus nylandii]
MVNLDSLPLPVLSRLVDELTPPLDPPVEERTALDWYRFERESFTPHVDVVALASVNKALREALLPTVFRCLDLGYPKADGGLLADYPARLRKLARRGGKVLACVRHLCIFKLSSACFRPAVDCLKQMTGLVVVEHASTLAFPPAFVSVLQGIPSFCKLYFATGGVESLPHILPLAKQVTHFEVECSIRPPLPASAVAHCPVTVAKQRRSRKPWNQSNLATVPEQTQALINGLSRFLAVAAHNLELLVIDGEDIGDLGGASLPFNVESLPGWTTTPNGGGKWLQPLFDAMMDDNRQYPAFPKLQRLGLKLVEANCVAFRHLLRTSATTLTHLELTTVDIKELPPPRQSLEKLSMLTLVINDNVNCANFVNTVLDGAHLRELVFNGLKPVEIPTIFGSPSFSGTALLELRLVLLPLRDFKVDHLRKIVSTCPNLELFMLKATWSGEALDFLAALHPLAKLRKFTFDHPFTAGRRSTFAESEGKTIRSVRNGDFRAVTVQRGQTVEGEIRGRIVSDLAAARRVYAKHYTQLASAMPALIEVLWMATPEVDWKWTFWREAVDVVGETRTKVRYKEETHLKIPPEGEPMKQTCVMSVGPPAGGGAGRPGDCVIA